MLEAELTEYVSPTKLYQNYNIWIGNNKDYTKNQLCNGSPFQKIDVKDSYVKSPKVYAEKLNLYGEGRGPFGDGEGRGMIWPFGAEHWCNLEGKFVHIVSDMSHLADE